MGLVRQGVPRWLMTAVAVVILAALIGFIIYLLRKARWL